MKLTQKQINDLREKYQTKRKDYIIKVVHRCMNYVYKICKGNIYYTETCVALPKDKIKRYSQRLDSMGVVYEIVENRFIVLKN